MNRTIRRLDLGEIEELLSWAAAEGWNPGINDAQAFQAADPNGFIGAFVGKVMVAALAAVAYDDAYGFIGLYICHAEWRGRGHGKAVWDAGIQYLGERTIGLDAVPEQRDNYASLGFAAVYETVRMSGTLNTAPAAREESARSVLGTIVAFERQCFPANRDAFLQHWLAPPNRVLVHVTERQTSAYAVVRRCIDGFKIGPLFADDLNAALAVLPAGKGVVHIDVPCFQAEFLSALSTLGFNQGFRTTRMYRGTAPAVRPPFIFGVTSLELG